MAKSNTEIYGWDENKSEESRIADMGLACMKSVGKTGEAEGSTGRERSDARDIDADIPEAKP